jgi:hypothetical protein
MTLGGKASKRKRTLHIHPHIKHWSKLTLWGNCSIMPCTQVCMCLLSKTFLCQVLRSLPRNTKNLAVAAIRPEQAALYGLSTNKKNEIYNPGFKFDVEKRLSVKVSYQHCKEANGGLRPNLNHIAIYYTVSPNYLRKEPTNSNRNWTNLGPYVKGGAPKLGWLPFKALVVRQERRFSK